MEAIAEQGSTLLDSISEFCRSTGIAESTFGRRAVNDGKFVARLRDGARITPETLRARHTFHERHGASAPAAPPELLPLIRVARRAAPAPAPQRPREGAPSRNFRFFDNRQKYLLFVNTCSEKEVVAQRVGMELAHIHPRPPAMRVFDAGMGDGTVLSRVMREMHRRFPTRAVLHRRQGNQPRGRAPVARQDGRPLLRASGDRAGGHQHVLHRGAVADAARRSAPPPRWCGTRSALTGTTAHEFSEQIAALEPFLAKNWQARHSAEDRQPDLRAAGRAGALPRRLPLPARRRDPAAGQGARRLRPGDRLAALPRARAGRIQGVQGDRAAGARARPGRPAARHPFLRPRSGAGDRAQDLAGREPVHDRPPRPAARGAQPSSARKRATSTSMPTPTRARCSATTCTRCRPRSPTASAPRRCSPPGTRPSTWRRSTTSASRDVRRRAQVPRRHARGAADARRPLVPG